MEVILDRVPATGEPFGRRTVEDRIVVGWVAPSTAGAGGLVLQTGDAVRAAALAPERRQSFVAGRALLTRLVTELFPGSTAWTVDTAACSGCGATHGPVLVRGVPVLVSVAHADGLVVAAVAPTGRVSRLGVDVVAAAEAGRWGEAQAVAKAGGHGLRLDAGLVRYGPGTARVEGASASYELREVAGPAGYRLWLAWLPATRPSR